MLSRVDKVKFLNELKEIYNKRGKNLYLIDDYENSINSGIKPYNVIQFRAGAPDKANLPTSDRVNLIKKDNCNLVNIPESVIESYTKRGYYFLPADEGDIKRANLLHEDIDQKYILLPQTKEGKVIDYNTYIPKNSKIYEEISSKTQVKYMPFTVINLTEFSCYSLEFINKSFNNKAIKSTTGSGSRGVWLLDRNRVHLGGKYVSELTLQQANQFIDFCDKEKCDVIIQDLVPNDSYYKKINVDFIIRKGKLLGYKWDEVNQSQQFTNWDNGYFIRNLFTDEVMDELTHFLVSHGIWNAIMNFEAFSDNESTIILIEFNWRYSNSMFEWSALDIDPLEKYIENGEFLELIPLNSRLRFSRNWNCHLYDDLGI